MVCFLMLLISRLLCGGYWCVCLGFIQTITLKELFWTLTSLRNFHLQSVLLWCKARFRQSKMETKIDVSSAGHLKKICSKKHFFVNCFQKILASPERISCKIHPCSLDSTRKCTESSKMYRRTGLSCTYCGSQQSQSC